MSIDWQAVGAIGTVLGALGTFLVVIFAIWKEAITSRLYGPKLGIQLLKDKGVLAPLYKLDPRTGHAIDETEAFWYHLKVTNDRPIIPARNCRVMLQEIYRKGQDGNYSPVAFNVPRQFVWAPSEFAPILQTITKEQILDFGYSPRNMGFTPKLYDPPGKFRGLVDANETVIYGVQIVAENFVSKESYYYKVMWDGKWSKDPDEMSTHLIIAQVTSPKSSA